MGEQLDRYHRTCTIVTPANGVNPIEVSMDLPPSTAVIDTPFPKWQVMILVLRSVCSIILPHVPTHNDDLCHGSHIFLL